MLSLRERRRKAIYDLSNLAAAGLLLILFNKNLRLLKRPYVMKIQTVGVAGAGIMGQGIATTSLLAGYRVLLYDIHPSKVEIAQGQIAAFLDASRQKEKITPEAAQVALSNLTTTTVLTDVVAEVVIDAVPENIELKQSLFKTLESVNSREAILATNTSSLSITKIGGCLAHPGRFLGIHFFNPAPLMKLVEIVRCRMTTAETIQTAQGFVQSLHKQAVLVQDSPGFIVNRIARFYYLESLRILEEGITTVQTMDQLLTASGFRMGPFQLMDLIGIDTNHEVTKSMYHSFFGEPRFRPSWLQQQMVDAGKLGKKTGSGFYEYPS